MDIAFERATVVLGFLTLTAALAVFASCRTIPALLKKLGVKNPMSSEGFQSFYFLHPFFWRAFAFLLGTHLILAIDHFIMLGTHAQEIHIHLIIISFGAASAASYGAMFASCRIINSSILKSLKPGSLSGKSYGVFNTLHSYYWLVVIALIATHFYFVHSHVGFWPTMGS